MITPRELLIFLVQISGREPVFFGFRRTVSAKLSVQVLVIAYPALVVALLLLNGSSALYNGGRDGMRLLPGLVRLELVAAAKTGNTAVLIGFAAPRYVAINGVLCCKFKRTVGNAVLGLASSSVE